MTLLRKPVREVIPAESRVDVGLTCNNGCDRCRERASCSTTEALARVDAVPGGCDVVHLFGGEPTIRRDFFQIAGAIQARGMGLVLVSNARVFSIDGFMERAARLPIRSVRIPVLAGTTEELERTTKVPGAYQQLLAGVRNLTKAGIHFEFHLVGFPPERARPLMDALSETGPERIVQVQLAEVHSAPAIDWPLCFGNGRVSEAAEYRTPAAVRSAPAQDGCEVLLVQPPHEGAASVMVPHSLLAVAGPLVEHGLSVRILDTRLVADPYAEIDQALASGARCVGLTFLTGPQITTACELIDYVKAKSPHTIVVAGGVHATLLPEQTAAYEGIDVVVAGEGEDTFLELNEALRSGRSFEDIRGIAYRDAAGGVVRTAAREPIRLDEHPRLPWSLLDRYGDSYGDATLHTSRGCPHRCGYCAIPVLHPRYRAQSPEVVIEQIKSLLARGSRRIVFLDDSFFVDRRRVDAIVEAILREGLRFTWMCEVRVDDVIRLGPDALARLAAAGMRQVFVGAESGSQRILDLVGKRITPQMTLQANALLRDAGIVPNYSFMTDFPSETADDFEQTRALIAAIKRDAPRAEIWRVNSFTPYPGTALFEEALRSGLAAPSTLRQWAAVHFYRREIPVPHERAL